MSTYRQFIFESYVFTPESGLLDLRYKLDDVLSFTESYTFDFPFVAYNPETLDRAIRMLFFLAGVSYYKRYLPPEIVIKTGSIDSQTAAFLSETYQRGLGEFWFVNKLDPRTPVSFPTTTDTDLPLSTAGPTGKGLLIGVGGGKDSLVTIEALRNHPDGVTTWSLNHRPLLEPLVERLETTHAWVERRLDPQLSGQKDPTIYHGHVPISAIFAAAGTIVAILTGRRDNIVSNEQSANEPTLHYQGVAINHQYSKSQDFERNYQKQLRHDFGENVRYYSYLRPITELRIAELFTKTAYQTYKDVFSSCNRAYVHGSEHLFWCGECSKCAFVFLMLTPFLPRTELEQLWHGKNLLLTPELEPTYRQLLGIEGDKPLDCVGEVKESRAAMQKAFETYPELTSKYQFELPEDYDFRAVATNEIPADIPRDLFAQ